METREQRSIEMIGQLRWALPVAIGVLSVGYILFEHYVLLNHQSAPSAIRSLVYFGVIGPVLAWFAMSWALDAAIARHEALEEVRERNRQLAGLHNISEVVSRSLELQNVLDEALDRIIDLLPVEVGSVRILDEDGLRLRSERGLSSDFVDRDCRVAVGECVCGVAVEEQHPKAVDGLRIERLPRSACREEGLRSILCIPLTSQTDVIGVLHVGRRAYKPFSSQEQDFLQAIGHQVGMALQNAGLYAEVKTLNQELEARVAERTAELESARQEVDRKARELEQLLRKTVQIQERERARIAQDMHNGVIQLIVGALYEVQSAREIVAIDPSCAEERLKMALDLLQQVEAETRRTIYDLRPPILDSKGLVPALRQYVARYCERGTRTCTLHVSGEPSRLPADAEIAIYRVVQEALHNVQTHSGATQAEVFVRFGARGLWLMVRDNGQGFNPSDVMEEAEHHLGLIGMRERIQSIGGELDIETEQELGTSVVVRIPANLFKR